MRGSELLGKMELIDPAYVEAADAFPAVKNRSRIRLWLLAACIGLLILSATAFATSDFGTRLLESFSGKSEPGSDYSESGFKLSVDIEKVPVNALKGSIQEVPALIRQQFLSYKPHMSWYPGHWKKTFPSRDAAYDYIGLKQLKYVPWDWKDKKTELWVHGNKNGDIQSVAVETFSTVGDINLQFFTNIYTKNLEGEITIRSVTTEYAEYSQFYYTTAQNKALHVIEQTALESGYQCMDGYLVEDGVLYHLHISHLEKDTDQAKKLLLRWADLF